MDFLCKICDRSVYENLSEYKDFLSITRKKIDDSLCTNYVIINVNLDKS